MHRFRFLSVLSLLLWGLVLSPVASQAQPRRIYVTATRSAAECVALTHYRANPLTLRLTLDKSRPTATGYDSIVAEIRRSVTDTTPALASSSITSPTGAGPFDIDFTGAQTNQDLAGKQSAPFWLVIYALSGNGEVLDVLHAGKLTLLEHGASLTAAAPPNAVGVLTRPAADSLYASLASLAALSGRVNALEATSGGVDPQLRLDLAQATPAAPYLRRFRNALAGSRGGGNDCKILCLGDSTTAGYGSSTTATSGHIKGYPRRLATFIGATPGLATGKTSLEYADTRWTVPSGWLLSGWGWRGWETDNATGPLVYTPGDGGTYDRFDVFVVKNPGGGVATITATGGTSVVESLNAANGVYKITAACPASSIASVSIAQAGQVWVLGVEPWNSAKPGIRVGSAGMHGWKASDWIAPGSLPAIGPLACAAAYQPDLTIIGLGLNDAAAGVSPSTLKAQIQTLITALLAYSDVAIWIPLPPAGPGVAPVELAPGIAGYISIYRELAEENNLLLIDTYSRLGGIYDGRYLYDGYHPNDAGYWEIAAAIAPRILPDLVPAVLGPLATGSPTPADIEVTDATKGLILSSPNGGRWRITVSNAGALTVAAP